MKPFRLLEAHEIDVRLQQFKKVDKNGKPINYPFAQYLLYKDARCDMNLMTEVYGELWKREHNFKDGKMYCKVSVWNKEINQWIEREDVGTESNTEQEKGQSSDSFKRACTNFGAGRELYSSPQIKIWLKDHESLNEYTKLYVSHIAYDKNENISELSLVTDKGEEVFCWGSKTENKPKNDTKKENKQTYTAKVESKQQTVENVEKDYDYNDPNQFDQEVRRNAITKEQATYILKNVPEEVQAFLLNKISEKTGVKRTAITDLTKDEANVVITTYNEKILPKMNQKKE